MCDWESPLLLYIRWGYCFNPWKGLCVIERTEVTWVIRNALKVFQSLKGIMCDWERRWADGVFYEKVFQSLKGIMCDWECSYYSLLNLLYVSIPERDYVWLREFHTTTAQKCLILVSIPERDYVWLREFVPRCWRYFLKVSIPERDYVWLRVQTPITQLMSYCFNPWKGLCVIESLMPCKACSTRLVSIPERDYVWLRVCYLLEF